MKKIIFILFCVTLNAQELTFTLEKSLRIGIENSKELQIAHSKIIEADAAYSEISSSMLPKLSLNASYAKLSEVDPFQVTLPGAPGPVTIQESFTNNYNLSATIEQPLFTGFKLSSLKSASEFKTEAEKSDYKKVKIEKIDNIQQSFWKYFTTIQVSTLIRENLDALNSHLKNTISFLENGLVTKNDFLKLKVEIANTELKLVDALNNEKIARAQFNKTIGLPLNSETNIIAEKLDNYTYSREYEDLLTQAREKRQELKSTKLQIHALNEMENAAKSDLYPHLFAFGNYYYNNPNQRILPLTDKFNDTWDVGVLLKWNIWNWGGTSAKVEQVKEEYLQAEKTFDLLEENIQMDVYHNYLNLQRAIKKIDLSDLQVESAEENYRITKQKYYHQLATSTDLIDAETSLLNAKTTLITSKVEYRIGLSALNRAIGEEVE